MAYNKKEVWQRIIKEMCSGKSLREILRAKDMPSRTTVYEWILKEKEKADQYAHANTLRADEMFDRILEIAFDDDEHFAKARLKIDSIKWVLSKMFPKKYGDKMDFTSDGNSISPIVTKRIE